MEGFNELQHLPKCPNLETISVESIGSSVELDVSHSSGMASWLGHCKRLRTLDLSDYSLIPSALTNLLLDKEIPLDSLRISYIENTLDRNFCRALSTRNSLTELSLTNLGDVGADDAEHTNVMECLLCLRSLDRLLVKNVISFKDRDIASLTRQLSGLKSFTFTCQEITDTIWGTLSNLVNLCELKLLGSSEFTPDGFLS